MPDPHLIKKIESCTSSEELEGLRRGLERFDAEITDETRAAIARTKAMLAKWGR